MGGFFPMRRGDLIYLIVLLVASVVCFLPGWRDISWSGMALSGWLLALLMVLSPTIALIRIAAERRTGRAAADAGPEADGESPS